MLSFFLTVELVDDHLNAFLGSGDFVWDGICLRRGILLHTLLRYFIVLVKIPDQNLNSAGQCAVAFFKKMLFVQ